MRCLFFAFSAASRWSSRCSREHKDGRTPYCSLVLLLFFFSRVHHAAFNSGSETGGSDDDDDDDDTDEKGSGATDGKAPAPAPAAASKPKKKSFEALRARQNVDVLASHRLAVLGPDDDDGDDDDGGEWLCMNECCQAPVSCDGGLCVFVSVRAQRDKSLYAQLGFFWWILSGQVFLERGHCHLRHELSSVTIDFFVHAPSTPWLPLARSCTCRTAGGLLVKSRVQRHDAMEAVAPKEDPEALAAASKKRKKKVRRCREKLR